MRIKRVVLNFQTSKIQFWRCESPWMREFSMTKDRLALTVAAIGTDHARWSVDQPRHSRVTIYERA